MQAIAEIKQLSASVINKIAAGEVIERPASVVKELMENCIDAGATRVDVSIEKGGIELIRVCDNGHGIVPEQMPMAVTSHATSKIDSAEDLFRVGTLGFRGEALASIAEVSRFLLRSRVAGEDAGYEMEVHGGSRSDVSPCGCPVGTTIEVRDLFFNTPVRRRFLRTTQTEMGHIGEAFTRIALGFPQVHFTLSHNDRVLHELPASHDLRDRIGRFFGPEIQNALIPVCSEDQGVELSGFVIDPTHSRSHNRMQYLFLNGRHIRDRALQHALSEAYRGLLLHGRSPIAFLRMEMTSDLIDVNVHPAKLEVRFQNGGQLYSQLLGTIRRIFLSTDLTAKVDPTIQQQNETALINQQALHAAHGARAGDQLNPVSLNQQAIDFRPDRPLADPFSIGQSRKNPEAENVSPDANQLTKTHASTDGSPEALAQSVQHPAPTSQSPIERTTVVPAGAINTFSLDAPQTHRPLAMQIHNRYLVSETDEGVIVIDQHALHERILYEELRKKVLAGDLEKQRLLVPEPVHFSSSEAALVLDHAEMLSKLGIEVEPFGGDTVLISSYPAMLANFRPAELLRQFVDLLLEGGKQPDRRDLLDSLLHMISCKAAVKAGDRLSPEEITLLIEHRRYCQDSHHCPHGRPTALVFSREELDRRFKRI
jgi:DNA mismatch repair protein MutL